MALLDSQHIVHAQLEVSACSAELCINGFPVAMRPHLGNHMLSIAVQEFLIPGENSLELTIEPGEPPSRETRRTLERSGAWARARLVLFREGASTLTVDSASVLAEVSLSGRPEPESFPARLKVPVELGQAFGAWSWQSAPTLKLNDALIEEAHAVLASASELMTSGSLERHWPFYEVKLIDTLRAYPAMTESYLRDQLEKILSHDAHSGGYVLPLNKSQHAFRLVTAGRVLYCVDSDGIPSVRFCEPEGAVLPCKYFLARIGGRLRVVR